MKKKLLFICIVLFSSFSSFSISVIDVNGKVAGSSYKDKEICIKDRSELHLVSTVPLINSKVYLETEDSWFYLTNIRPSEVVANWLKYVYVGTSPAVLNENVRVEIYRHGAVIIPHSKTFEPLEVFTEPNFQGISKKYSINTYHNNLGELRAAIRSFKLKKGYMATLAVNPDGTGYSRVFIADSEDLEVPALQTELNQTVSFIRVFRWRWVSKKGWAGTGDRVNKVQATWFYGWNASGSSTLDAEYSPMRHFRYWPSWDQINSQEYSTAVLGFNEPENSADHKDDDPPYMTVDECVELWPNLLKSGLRIGSVATTTDRQDYLYDFIDKCDARNLRVDFVAVHFYSGGFTAKGLYDYLNAIHKRTKRPLWITEWNNGANWTSESWPETGKYQKQLSDMTSFFNMLDTTSFVERHAVYNNVEWFRYMIDDSGNLTPAGEMMKNFNAKMAYNPKKEFIPKAWKYQSVSMDYFALSSDKSQFTFRFVNPNGAVVKAFLIERKIGDGVFEQIDSVSNTTLTQLTYPADPENHSKVSYRMRFVGKDNKYYGYTSQLNYFITPNEDVQIGKVSSSNTDWITLFPGKTFRQTPVALFGAPTNNNSALLTLRGVSSSSRVNVQLLTWKYSSTAINKEDEIPYLLLDKGTYDWGGLKAIAGTTTASGTWSTVTFDTPFNGTPAVFVMQTSANSSTATAIRIKNVTSTGFDVLIQKERAQTYETPSENIAFVAVNYGTGTIGQRKIVVGRTAQSEVGTSVSAAATVNWAADMENPLFFSFMQSSNDEVGAIIRADISGSTAKIFKQAETSSSGSIRTETAAWMVIEGKKSDTSSSLDSNDSRLSNQPTIVYPNPVRETLYVSNMHNKEAFVVVFSALGKILKKEFLQNNSIYVGDLPPGCYLIQIDSQIFKFIKE